MRCRAYRRKQKIAKDRRLAKMVKNSRYPHPAGKVKILDNGEKEFWVDGEYDYIKRYYRSKRSSFLKKSYTKKLRNGKIKHMLFQGGTYKKASGDFWWDYI